MSALVLSAVAAWSFTTAVAGGVAGLVLGNIRLPVIVFAASSPAAGAGANIGISGVAAATAAAAHLRAGRVSWRLFAWMAPPSLVGVVAGAIVSGTLPGDVLLAVIGIVLVAFGVDLVRPRPRGPDGESRRENLPAIVGAGAVIGFLGGVVGLILGALRLPTLLRVGGVEPLRVVGTNLAVGVVVGAAGVVAHAPSGVDWSLFAVGAGASIPGALVGARLTGRLDERALLRVVGAILLAAGTAALVQAIV